MASSELQLNFSTHNIKEKTATENLPHKNLSKDIERSGHDNTEEKEKI
jgi:hypothetical protein